MVYYAFARCEWLICDVKFSSRIAITTNTKQIISFIIEQT